MPTGRREVPEPPAAQALARQPGKASTPDPHITTKSLRESPSVRNLSLDKLAGLRRGCQKFGPGWSRRDDSEGIFSRRSGATPRLGILPLVVTRLWRSRQKP